MARRCLNVGAPSTHSTTVLRDERGDLILEIGHHDYVVVMPDGSLEQHRVASSVTLVDGTVWNPGMRLPLGVCADCRHPPFSGLGRDEPSHGLVALNRAKLCSRCGVLGCPRHITKRGGLWLCRSCARRSRVLGFLRSLFFTEGG